MVLRVKAIVDRTMKRIDITAIICNWTFNGEREKVMKTFCAFQRQIIDWI